MKVIANEEVYKAKYFRINKTTFERDGKTFTKDFIHRNPAVFILPIAANGNIHMIRQHRDAFDKTILEIVAGMIEEGDNPLESAKRELQEETGLTAKKWKQIASWELSVNMNSKVYVFVAKELTEGNAAPEEDEKIERVMFSLPEAIEKVFSGEIVAAPHAAALLLYKELVKQGKV